MRLLISDANILIDIENGDLTLIVFRLPYEIAVPDILFEVELRERHSRLLEAGLKVKSLTADSVKKAEHLRAQYPGPSILDHSALALAAQEQCALLTGDKHLRAVAQKEGVEVHGTIWIIEQLLKQRLIQVHKAKTSFDTMKATGSRLPWGDVDKLVNQWELDGSRNE